MAINNAASFQRFTALTPNIAIHGSTVEEFKMQRGNPDGNPIHSPMAAPKASNVRLALSPTGSDNLRLATPSQPVANPYEGPKLALVLSRTAVSKINSPVVSDLHSLVQGGAIADSKVSALMLDSLGRVSQMSQFMEHLNGLSESVMMNSLAVSKG